MEEKERYKYYTETNQIYDSEEDELYAYNLNNNKIISILNQQDKRIKELEALLKTVREFETPRISRYAVVQYSHWENKPYKIVKCYDCYKDKDMKIVYCYYGVKSTNFKVIKVCDTEEEAKSLIKQLRENSCNGKRKI